MAQFSSVAQSCLTFCDPMDCSTPGFPVHHQLLELTQTCGSAGKESACNVGDLGSIPGLERSPEEGKGYPLQYSDLENSMDCIGSQRVGGGRETKLEINLKHITNTETLKDTVYTNWNKSSGIPYSSVIASSAYMSLTPSNKTNTCYLFILNYKI